MTERSHQDAATTDQLYLGDAYQRGMEATVVGVEGSRVALDRTVFYATGGGQPHDTGTLAHDGATWSITDVRKEGPLVWHTLTALGEDPTEPPAGLPSVGAAVEGTIDWDRRHGLMRTHTMLHVMGGVVWNRWQVPATGGNMDPLAARMDFEFGPLPEGFRDELTEAVNAELAADRPIEVSFLDRAAAEVGRFEITKTESKGKGNKRLRLKVM